MQNLNIHPDLIMDHLDGYTTVLAPATGNHITLNQTGSAVWHCLIAGQTADQIVAYLVAHYIITPAQAQKDVDAFLQELAARGYLQ